MQNSPATFAELGVSETVVDALVARNITHPFPVQELVIRDVLDGTDVLVQSPTGSGKTLAFGVPMVDRLDSNGPRPAALILAPTRELASQIVDEMYRICHSRALKIAAVYGGVGIHPQIKAVRKAHIVVATPGRLEDLIERRAIDLSAVRILVLDEADRMLDMGFKPPVDRIVSLLPRKRQTLFFSATLEGAAGKLAAEYTYQPRTHVQAPATDDLGEISHRFMHLGSQNAKLPALLHVLRGEERGRTLVFVRTKRGADRLVKKLTDQREVAQAMHGDKSQAQRQRALAAFERGDLQTLVATDVAARGIDIVDVTHVVNFDMPEDSDTYTHRVGRTGRAGADGDAITFVLGDQRREMRSIAKTVGVFDQFDAASPGEPSSPQRDARHSVGGEAGERDGSPRRSRRHNPNSHRKGSQGFRAAKPGSATREAAGSTPRRDGEERGERSGERGERSERHRAGARTHAPAGKPKPSNHKQPRSHGDSGPAGNGPRKGAKPRSQQG